MIGRFPQTQSFFARLSCRGAPSIPINLDACARRILNLASPILSWVSVFDDAGGDSSSDYGLTKTCSYPAIQLQFRRWGFPARYQRVRKDDNLVAKVKELWQRNVNQKEMHRIIVEEEGYEISARELVRLRLEHKMLLRGRNGDKALEAVLDKSDLGDDQDEDDDEDDSIGIQAGSDIASPATSRDRRNADPHAASSTVSAQDSPSELFPAPAHTFPMGKGHNKPRRLTRGLSGRPRDAAGPPRFPSELTLDESKAILRLDEEGYTAVRNLFSRLCEQAGVVKKTIAGPEQWEGLKDELVRQFPPLQAEIWRSRDNSDSKKLALDVICTDCTKRLRLKKTRITVTNAKTVLGIDPQETRELRAAFYHIVNERGVHSKTQAGPKLWNDLKNEWALQSPIIRRTLEMGSADAAHEEKLKALEMLARDVVKRRWDDALRAKKRKTNQKTSTENATPVDRGQVPPAATFESRNRPATRHATAVRFDVDPAPEPFDSSPLSHLGDPNGGNQGHSHLISSYPTHGNTFRPLQVQPHQQRAQLDSTVGSSLQMAANGNTAFIPGKQPPHMQPHAAMPGPSSSSTAAFLRLHPASTFAANVTLWIATLNDHTIRELRQAATEKFSGAAACVRVEGIIKDGKGGEMPLLIDGDSELEAYLVHLNGATPTFSVQLVPDWQTG